MGQGIRSLGLNQRRAAEFRNARIARLATVDPRGRPHLVPVCFACRGLTIYIALDRKPKRIPVAQLARVRNIRAHPNVALLVDQYREDWSRLWFVLIRGRATLLTQSGSTERQRALHLLRRKYRQYRGQLLPEDAPVIRIRIQRVTAWGR
jgi:PPOX class probable F420-dependent enzyme